MVGELEGGWCTVFRSEGGGALEVEGFAGEGVREEVVDVVVDKGDEGEDQVEVQLLLEVEGREPVERGH